MSDQYVGEIRAFGFNFAPYGWAWCNGQLLSIQQYTALFSLLGTYFGGNGTSNFQLPNLQGTVPMHWGNGSGLSPYVLGETVGSTTMTLSQGQMWAHSHAIQVAEAQSAIQSTAIPSSSAWLGLSDPAKSYVAGNQNATMSANSIGFAGASQPHINQQPYLTLNYCIALTGAYPPRG
jgi:microcystin-dependent protein